ncbi:MAG: hypothetical protein ABL895_02560 [Cyclobacteriaceae bacterium]
MSFAFFLLITVVVLTMNIISALRGTSAWYNYLIIVLLVPIGLFVAYKIFIRYKVIRAGNNQIEINYPVLRRSEKYPLQSVLAWRENIVKTGKNSVYKQLEILFEDKKRISLGHKEHTEYPKLVQYLQHKIPRKKTAAS